MLVSSQKAENGDLNWIIPGRFIAFCGPHSRTRLESGMQKYGTRVVFLLKVSPPPLFFLRGLRVQLRYLIISVHYSAWI